MAAGVGGSSREPSSVVRVVERRKPPGGLSSRTRIVLALAWTSDIRGRGSRPIPRIPDQPDPRTSLRSGQLASRVSRVLGIPFTQVAPTGCGGGGSPGDALDQLATVPSRRSEPAGAAVAGRRRGSSAASVTSCGPDLGDCGNYLRRPASPPDDVGSGHRAARSDGPPAELLPRVHSVSLLKRWVLARNQGAISHAHGDSARAAKAVTPAQLDQIGTAGVFRTEAHFELTQCSRIIVHGVVRYILGLPE